jgi:hypothetical protein
MFKEKKKAKKKWMRICHNDMCASKKEQKKYGRARQVDVENRTEKNSNGCARHVRLELGVRGTMHEA